MLTLPSNFEALIKTYLKAVYYPSTRKKDFAGQRFTEGDYRFFAKGIAKMSAYFTAERSSLPKNYFNQKELRSGYLFYFLPINALKIRALASQLPADFFAKPRNILDLGSGPATASIGLLWAAPSDWQASFTLLDQNRHILGEGKALIDKMQQNELIAAGQHVQIKTSDLKPLSLNQIACKPGYDLIILSNVLNEINPPPRRQRLIKQLIKKLARDGRILIIEPALRHPTRELMELRNQIALNQMAYIEAPCLHQEACPMYADSARDWCHMYWDWQRPTFIEKLDRLIGIRKDYLKASYLILSKEKPKHDPSIWRVVSGPLNSKGKSERLLCGRKSLPHLRRLTRLDRDRSKENADFDLAMRGDIVETDVKERIGKKDTFKISRGPGK